MNRILNFFLRSAKGIFVAIQVGVVVCIVLGCGFLVGDVFPVEHSMANATLACIGIPAVVLIVLLFSFLAKMGQNGKPVFFKICGVIYAIGIFFLQIYVCKCIYFTTTWDVSIIHSAADALARECTMADWIAQCGTDWFAAGYYDSYPNNIFLTVILAGIKKFTYFLGFSDGYFACIVAGVILVDISIFLITLTVKRLTKDSRLMVLTLILATIFLGFNPWIIIPYSDTYAVLFTSIVMYLYCLETAGWKRYLQWFGIVVTSMVGTYIKPTVIIALMAIVIVELLHISKERIREFLLKGVILVAAVIAVSAGISTLNRNIYKERDVAKQTTLYHYLMLGLNGETYGAYSGEDRAFSWGYSDPDERKKEQLRVVGERLQERGVIGSLDFYMKKILIVNKDGVFSWKWEGGFFGEYRGLQTENAKKLQDFYYGETNRSMYNVFQGFWITIQILTALFAILYSWTDKKQAFLAISLIGINLFLMLFEVRARYLILYIPYYIVMAMVGVSLLRNLTRERKKDIIRWLNKN